MMLDIKNFSSVSDEALLQRRNTIEREIKYLGADERDIEIIAQMEEELSNIDYEIKRRYPA